jgi:FkbM family methyltransferase
MLKTTKRLKSLTWSTAHRMGYVIHKSNDQRAADLFSLLGIDLLIDVGANRGEYGLSRRRTGYKGEIISFEPLSASYASLRALAGDDPKWTVGDRMAIGDRSDEIEINLASNSVSSSVLPMLETHVAAAPQARYIGRERVPLRRLDEVAGPRVAGRRVYLKLDVQGFERQVLSGAERILEDVVALQLEMSLLPLYQGEVLMPEMCQFLLGKGFEVWDLQPGFRDPETGRLLQIDGVFTKPDRGAENNGSAIRRN